MTTDPTKIIFLKYDDMFHEVFFCENVIKQFLSDVLDLPPESIRTARVVTPRLRKRYRRQKLGILDIIMYPIRWTRQEKGIA